MPIELPEHDPTLIVNRKTAQRFLEMLRPSPDDPETPLPLREDERPRHYASHDFMIRRDDGAESSMRLAGTFEEHFATLEAANVKSRCGVFVEIDTAGAIVATIGHVRSAPAKALLLWPSLSVLTGRGPAPDYAEIWQYVWLVGPGLGIAQRESLAELLRRDHDATDVVTQGKALVRVPGFYNRSGKPTMVAFHGAERSQGMTVDTYSAEELIEGFKLAASAPRRVTGRKGQGKAA